MTTRPFQLIRLSRQRGAAAVEFALVSAFGGFMIALFAAIETGRVLFFMNSANEATELGARVAVVCDANSPLIKQRMQQIMPSLDPGKVSITYGPAGCAASAQVARETCDIVTVAIAPGLKVDAIIPFVNFGFDMPAFATTKPREAMDSSMCTAT